MADGTYQPKVYMQQGGDNEIIASGGSVDVQSGGAVAVESGGAVNVASGGNIVLASGAKLQSRRVMEHHSTGDTLLAAETGSVHSNNAASGAIVIVLPAATVGLEFILTLYEAEELRIDPNGTETIVLPSSGAQGAAGKYLTANAIMEHIHLVCVTAGTWDFASVNGTWAHEG